LDAIACGEFIRDFSINTYAGQATRIVLGSFAGGWRCCMDRAKVELSLFPADLRSDV
jgi:hypothetical protein